MQLRNISIPHLIAEAGGDPWAINQTLQVGRPAQISELAEAFRVAAWCTAESHKAFEDARQRFEASWNHENGDNPINDSAEVQRVVRSLGAQSLQLPRIGVDLEYIAANLAEAQQKAREQIARLEGQLQELDDEIGHAMYDAADANLTPYDRAVLNAIVSTLEHDAIGDTKSMLAQVQSVRSRYSDYLQTVSMVLRTDGYDAEAIAAAEAPGTPTKAEPEANRRQNEIDAFTKAFHRPPNSEADWETATALDPHSYAPKNGGVPPNIVVQRIKPVPGQGVVRTNLFIPDGTVFNVARDPDHPIHLNLGDERGFSPTAGPEASRVSIYVDYENGIVVARQNPSIDRNSGRIISGTPSVSATQNDKGSVVVEYIAADPFTPGGEGFGKAWGPNVSGTITFDPAEGGPRVSGSATNYPAIEIYSDRPGANLTPLVHSSPTVDGPLGPVFGLWLERPIVPLAPPLGATPPIHTR
jgi:hypothetical protein